MPIINLRSQYPHLSEDIFMEISDPIFEVYDHSRKQIKIMIAGRATIVHFTHWTLATA